MGADYRNSQTTTPRPAFPAGSDHTKDSDCTVDPLTNCCKVCGVDHSEPCLECGGKGYHSPNCPELQHTGNTIPALERTVIRVTRDRLADYYVPCPVEDCPGGHQLARRLYTCADCGFKSCGACMDAHEREGHTGDSDTAREMYSSIGGLR